MCLVLASIAFLTHSPQFSTPHSLGRLAVHMSPCPSVRLAVWQFCSLSFSLSPYLSPSLLAPCCLLFVPHIYDSANVCSQSVEYLMPSSSKRWRRQFLKCLGCCCPPLFLLTLLPCAVGSSLSSIHLKIWHQMSASASASSFVVCMPICARFSLVFPYSVFLYPTKRVY